MRLCRMHHNAQPYERQYISDGDTQVRYTGKCGPAVDGHKMESDSDVSVHGAKRPSDKTRSCNVQKLSNLRCHIG